MTLNQTRKNVRRVMPAAAADTASKTDITTTNWWHTLSTTEIRTFLNGIFASEALHPARELNTHTRDEHLKVTEIARKSEEMQNVQTDVAEGVEKLSADASSNFDDH